MNKAKLKVSWNLMVIWRLYTFELFKINWGMVITKHLLNSSSCYLTPPYWRWSLVSSYCPQLLTISINNRVESNTNDLVIIVLSFCQQMHNDSQRMLLLSKLLLDWNCFDCDTIKVTKEYLRYLGVLGIRG